MEILGNDRFVTSILHFALLGYVTEGRQMAEYAAGTETLGRKEDHVEGLSGDERKLLKQILKIHRA